MQTDVQLHRSRKKVAGQRPNDRAAPAGVQFVAAEADREEYAGCGDQHGRTERCYQSEYTGTAAAPQESAAGDRLQSGGDTEGARGAHHPGNYEKTSSDTGDFRMSAWVSRKV